MLAPRIGRTRPVRVSAEEDVMRLSAGRALNDIWMRVRTSLQLVSAIARTARRHKELLLFPVLSFVATASLFVGIVVLIVQADNLPPMGLVCLLYTSDAADDLLCVDLGGRRI